MRQSLAVILSVTLATGIAFSSDAALAESRRPVGHAPGQTAPAASDPPTTVTFAVTSGDLTITVPTSGTTPTAAVFGSYTGTVDRSVL